MDPHETPQQTLYSVARSARTDVLLTIYFLGMALSGLEGLLHPGELGSLLEEATSGLIAYVFSWAMLVVGMSGISARLADSRSGEFYAVIGIAVLTVLNAAALLPEHPQTALRLAFAPCMMIPYGWMRLGFTINRHDVYRIQRALLAEQEQGRGQGDES